MLHILRVSPLLAAVNRAYKMFDDEEQLQYCMSVAEEAKELLDQRLDEKRKQAKKEGRTGIEEDDPVMVSSYHCMHSALLYQAGINTGILGGLGWG